MCRIYTATQLASFSANKFIMVKVNSNNIKLNRYKVMYDISTQMFTIVWLNHRGESILVKNIGMSEIHSHTPLGRAMQHNTLTAEVGNV
jgi:hypothetical protein